jgi:phosphatidylserine/phosphatidylglycerophosphate/cardiolipin synthase-like enzyme
MTLRGLLIGWLALGCLGCGAGGEDGDGQLDELAPAGKADGLYGECEVAQVLAYANDPDSTLDKMKADGIYTRAANNIVAFRDGADGLPGTSDDRVFETIEQLDAIYYVGPKTMQRLVEACKHRCWALAQIDVIFSPQAYAQSHLARVVALIDSAQRSVDVAMYSFSDYGIRDALDRAVRRGVAVRFLFESANADRSDPAGSWSAKLEDLGIDVRYINKIMHHKFAIIDGPIDSLDEGYTGTLITGSGNWSNSAGTRYDENTVFVHGSGELLLRFQQEFNLVWENSRDFVWAPPFDWVTTKPIADALIVDDAWVDTAFTSANFKTYDSRYGRTFSVIRGENTIADKLVELIQDAQHSIHIASGHLRSRPVAEALLAKWAENPQMDIRVYLDQQEYISEWTNSQQELELLACLEAAGTSEAQAQDCYDKGFYFSYPIHAAGIPLKFKTYCYRWHYTYAVQMHHKYLVFDGQTVASGSYNLSDNAEHNTIENMVIYRAERFPALVAAFEDNFERIWVTGEAEGLYQATLDEVEHGGDSFPIVFDSMALTWQQVTTLKEAIRANCPEINSDAFRNEPQVHTTCSR